MADVTKEKILRINTQNAGKNVKTLKQQIKELREQMAQLEKGTESYDRVAKQLADTNQKQIEINEAMRYSNKDLGATLSNLTRVSAGVVGAISSINSVMVLMGADSDEAMEALKHIQALMAIIQGMSAIDTATKALKGLTVAFKGFSTARGVNAAVTAGAATAELAEAGALVKNTKEMKLNNEVAGLYNDAQRSNTAETNKSTNAIIKKTAVMQEAARLEKILVETSNGHDVTIQHLNKRLKEGSLTFDEYARKIESFSKSISEQTWTLTDMSKVLKNAPRVRNADTTSLNANTAATNANTKSKEANAVATGKMAGAEQTLGTATQKNVPVMKKAWSGLTTGIKNAAKAIKSFVVANPVLAAIAAAVALVAGALAIMANAAKKAMAEMRAAVEFNNEITHSYEEQQIRLNVLLNTARDEAQTVNERKKAIEELNKLIPNYNAELDETTGKYKENTNALNDYLNKLREKIELEAYEGRIKDLLQQRLELEQKLVKVQTSGWNIFGIRVKNIKNDIKDVDKEIEKLYGKINDLYLPWALDNNNKSTQSPAKTILKTFKEIIDNIKSLYGDIWNTIFNEKELRITYNGVYRETDILFNNIERLIKSRNIQGLLSDEFKKAMSEGFTEDMNYHITLDWVFDRTQQEKFYSDLQKERAELEKMMADKNRKYTDEEIKSQQDIVNGLKAEGESRKLVIEAVQKYFIQRRKEADETGKLADAQEEYNRQLEIEKEYIKQQRRGDRDADSNKEIALGKQQIEIIKQRIQYRQSEIDMLKSLPLQNEQILSRIKELNAEQLEDQKKTDEELARIDNAYYQKRLNHLESEKNLIIANSEKEQRAEEIRRMLAGGGVLDYNTDVDLINMQLKAIEQQKKKVDSYYEKEKSKYAEDTDERIRLEQERLEALDRLNEEYSKKDIERQMADADRKLQIQKTYITAYQNISSQIGSILSAEMERYDENSKEYKKLKYAQGVMTTAEGVLAAFMSGVESGIPAPGNFVLAGVLSSLALAAGIMQLNNIKNEKLGGSMPNTVEIGSEYDTLSYQTNVDTLSAIQDQRCYVLESDISSTQQRVQVQETQATF